ncbi:cardiolipin synthase [Haloferula luteola]|uniref:Cardiolipin synthase n=1 Tax=Haloferula luteola TaxID=595692 RepID=A0A840V1L7_9BACT|nr:cardiolipin synthase [Haloferula luteola]MBB5351885.1 cardiolipin synthase [Haloferula luteola]
MHIIGFFQSISAVMDTRTSQGAIAWAISLNTFPVVAVPAYMIFGDNDFQTYVTTRQAGIKDLRPMAEHLIESVKTADVARTDLPGLMGTLSNLSSLPVTYGNQAEILVDGSPTFESIFEAIDQAENYILVQFYIIRDDETGRGLAERLARKAREGVQVYLLYDDYGCLGLSSSYLDSLRQAGVHAQSFLNLVGGANRFQLNFRNHRKLVVVDGKTAFVGGHNVGDEYLGLHPTLSPWRDTHMRLTGPVVTSLQVPFAEDWNWATGEILDHLDWNIESKAADTPDGMEAIAIPTGPADPMETCSLYYLAAIHAAQKRLWIATPYFVPDEPITQALQLAGRRGVDVRILIPEQFDSSLVRYSSYSYLRELEMAGVQIWRFQKGFMHQKVLLVDDDFATIGSANVDNRSFRLNFELQVGIRDVGFASQVEAMLREDFSHSRRARPEDLDRQSWPFKVGVRVSRLLAPIQ